MFCDLDGTLIGPDERIAPRVREAIVQARARGCEVVLCTGRARYTTFPIAAQLPPPAGYAITSNGGVITHLGTGETILRRLMPAETAIEIARAMYAAGAQPYVYEDTPQTDAENNRVLYHPARPVGPFALPPRYVPYENLLEQLPFAPVSVSTFAPEAVIRPLTLLLKQQFGDSLSFIEVGTHRNWGVEVYAKGVSKQLGLEVMAARLDIGAAKSWLSAIISTTWR